MAFKVAAYMLTKWSSSQPIRPSTLLCSLQSSKRIHPDHSYAHKYLFTKINNSMNGSTVNLPPHMVKSAAATLDAAPLTLAQISSSYLVESPVLMYNVM